MGRRMIVSDQPAASPNPFEIDAIGTLPASHMKKIKTTPSVNGKLR